MMKSRKSDLTYNPFQDLKVLLEARSLSLPDYDDSGVIDEGSEQTPEFEEKLFREAMEGVMPISEENHVERTFQIDLPEGSRRREDAEILSRLRDLITHGTGFNVSETPEYIEGTGYNVDRGITKRLHQGDFSIQAHVDLHGLTADAAEEVFERFLKWAVTTGKKGVLIVHGRGLSSPAEPVLKKRVVEWLTRGPWRKWVVAYCSARVCDGGAGATYVLLRQRPVSKRMKMKRTKSQRKA
jgi:DNA-nicking Smr family endonuclease